MAYFDWRQEITSDITERSKVALEITEADLKERRACQKKDELKKVVHIFMADRRYFIPS